MLQLILTYLAILYAVSYILYSTYKSFLKKQEVNQSGACSGGCSNCSLKSTNSALVKNQIHKPIVVKKAFILPPTNTLDLNS